MLCVIRYRTISFNVWFHNILRGPTFWHSVVFFYLPGQILYYIIRCIMYYIIRLRWNASLNWQITFIIRFC